MRNYIIILTLTTFLFNSFGQKTFNTKELKRKFLNSLEQKKINTKNSSEQKTFNTKDSSFVKESFEHFTGIKSFKTISSNFCQFKPFRIKNRGYQYVDDFYLYDVSHDGKIGLIMLGYDKNKYSTIKKMGLIDLHDGCLIYEFNISSFSCGFFNSDDSKLFFKDGDYVKVLNTESLKISTLFEIKKIELENWRRSDKEFHLFLEENTLHFTWSYYKSPYYYDELTLHQSFNTVTGENSEKVINNSTSYLKGSDTDGSEDLMELFNSYSGSTKDKLLNLQIDLKDKLIVKSLKSSTTEVNLSTKADAIDYVLVYLPFVFHLKGNTLEYLGIINILETDRVTNKTESVDLNLFDYKEQKKRIAINVTKSRTKHLLTDGFELILSDASGSGRMLGNLKDDVYVLPLFENGEFRLTHKDPEVIKGKNIMYSLKNDKTNNLFIQVRVGSYYFPIGEFEKEKYLFIYNGKFKKNGYQNEMSITVDKKLREIDSVLSIYHKSILNSIDMELEPLESEEERYQRVYNEYKIKRMSFESKKNSAMDEFNKLVRDSIKTVDYDPSTIFKPRNYDREIGAWRLSIPNPFGKDFSTLFYQEILYAKEDIKNKYQNIGISVQYYFNAISMNYEPLFLILKNQKTKNVSRQLIPFNDNSLLDNLFFKESDDAKLLVYEDRINKYFINNGITPIKIKNPFVNQSTHGKTDHQRSSYKTKLKYWKISDLPFYIEYSKSISTGNYKYRDAHFLENINSEEEPFEVSEPIRWSGSVNKLYDWRISNKIVYALSKVTYGGVTTDEKITTSYDISPSISYYDAYTPGFLADFNAENVKDMTAHLEVKNNVNEIIYKFDLMDLGSYEIKSDDNDFKIYTHSSFSPNGKFLIINSGLRSYLFKIESSKFKIVEKIYGVSGPVYWDCNSNYLGIGNAIIPVGILY
ncbi:hypothetical protein N8289_00770 [Flavobacteriales bacterium]|nr:hypothetical protein [Flavobacteriales bacterium]